MSRGSGGAENKRKQVSWGWGELRGQVACGNLWVTYVTKKRETHGTNRSNYQLHVLTLQESLYLTFFLPASDLVQVF